MYTLKSTLKRGMTLSAGLGLVVASFASSISPVFADALNPLTERSLTLSSSSPGWAYTDGSNNSTYAPPNSGANGQKSGNYFSFRVSTNSALDADTSGAPDNPIKAMSFQYCTKSAGQCIAPGTNVNHTTGDTATTSDLRVTYPSAAEVDSGDFATVIDAASTGGDVKAVPGYTNNNPKYSGSGDAAEAAKNVAGNFIVMWNNAGTWTQSTGWTATSSNQEEATGTGQDNTIILQNATGLGLPAGTQVKVLFFATDTDYITNPGAGAFFVKINTFKTFDALTGGVTLKDNIDNPGYVIDGGVTVANVMNQSIQITTKVLETMQFSVGTVDPDTLDSTDGATDTQSTFEKAVGYTPTGDTHKKHTTCDIILKGMTPTDAQNVLELGDQASESSLSTEHTYATHSYWRLSSNSSAGATVYYSGHTLSNTSGDEIKAIGASSDISNVGSEQFGLAIAKATLSGGNTFDDATNGVDYSVDRAAGKNYENAADTNDAFSITGVHDSTLTDLGATNAGTWDYTGLNDSFHMPRLDPLNPRPAYGNGSGQINSDGQGSTSAQFAFNPMSDTVPEPIADESSQVVDCVTAKMRYIGNIAATTPAGIYTTKINYIAAPQY